MELQGRQPDVRALRWQGGSRRPGWGMGAVRTFRAVVPCRERRYWQSRRTAPPAASDPPGPEAARIRGAASGRSSWRKRPSQSLADRRPSRARFLRPMTRAPGRSPVPSRGISAAALGGDQNAKAVGLQQRHGGLTHIDLIGVREAGRGSRRPAASQAGRDGAGRVGKPLPEGGRDS
jgi:hypothetical protein